MEAGNGWYVVISTRLHILEIPVLDVGLPKSIAGSRDILPRSLCSLHLPYLLDHHPDTRDPRIFCPTAQVNFQSAQVSSQFCSSKSALSYRGITNRLMEVGGTMGQAYFECVKGDWLHRLVQKHREDWECVTQCLVCRGCSATVISEIFP